MFNGHLHGICLARPKSDQHHRSSVLATGKWSMVRNRLMIEQAGSVLFVFHATYRSLMANWEEMKQTLRPVRNCIGVPTSDSVVCPKHLTTHRHWPLVVIVSLPARAIASGKCSLSGHWPSYMRIKSCQTDIGLLRGSIIGTSAKCPAFA